MDQDESSGTILAFRLRGSGREYGRKLVITLKRNVWYFSPVAWLTKTCKRTPELSQQLHESFNKL